MSGWNATTFLSPGRVLFVCPTSRSAERVELTSTLRHALSQTADLELVTLASLAQGVHPALRYAAADALGVPVESVVVRTLYPRAFSSPGADRVRLVLYTCDAPGPGVRFCLDGRTSLSFRGDAYLAAYPPLEPAQMFSALDAWELLQPLLDDGGLELQWLPEREAAALPGARLRVSPGQEGGFKVEELHSACEVCGQPSSKVCGACRQANLCCDTCMQSFWRQHRGECGVRLKTRNLLRRGAPPAQQDGPGQEDGASAAVE
jgi:hypothetical protein